MSLANICLKLGHMNLNVETFLLKIVQLICEKLKNIIRYTNYNNIFLFLPH
jgi:hypothetical protein